MVDSREWRAFGPFLEYRGECVGQCYGGHNLSAEDFAEFLGAAAEHYRKFLGETERVPDAEIDSSLMLFAEKTQKDGKT